MTTIAIDKNFIAWDSRITQGNEIVDYPAEKVWIVGKKIMAFAGDFALLDEVIDWYGKGARAKAARDTLVGEWELLVIDNKGAYFYSDQVPHRSRVSAPFAMGSGGPYARGALLAGASAYKAVQIACRCDALSGGEISSKAFDEVF